jgi:hypothetical protein
MSLTSGSTGTSRALQPDLHQFIAQRPANLTRGVRELMRSEAVL